MWRPLLIIILIFAALAGLYYYYNKPTLAQIDGTAIDASRNPIQHNLIRPKSFEKNKGILNLMINPMAKYSISARILAKKRYVRGWESEVSPWDIVFGWGDAANLLYTKNLDIRQTVRWYSYKISTDIPMEPQYIVSHTSNNHIVPANDNIRKAILFLKEFDIVHLEGYLVNITGKRGNKYVSWISSLSREDTGNGACEIFYVEKVKIGEKVYK